MSDVENFLADVPAEDAPINLGVGEQVEKEPSSESPTETKPKEEAPSSPGADNKENEEEKLPFHKHPRWKEMYNKNKDLEGQLTKMRDELESKINTISVSAKASSEELPDDFVKLYGDNHEAYKLWRKQQDDLAERIKAEISNEMEQKSQAERQALEEGERYVEESIRALEEDGKTFDKNELMKFLLDFKEKYGALPEDDRGNIDFMRGYELMTTMKGSTKTEATTKAKKEIADFSGNSGRGRGEGAVKDYLTSNDLRNTGWDSLIGT